MKAVLVPVGEMPRVIEVEGLKDLQKAVGGCIDVCDWVFNDRPTVYVNDEGKFTQQPNRAVFATKADEGGITWDGSKVKEGDLLDIIYGDFVCIGFDPETGEDRDITDAEIKTVNARFGNAKSIHSGFLEALRIKAEAMSR